MNLDDVSLNPGKANLLSPTPYGHCPAVFLLPFAIVTLTLDEVWCSGPLLAPSSGSIRVSPIQLAQAGQYVLHKGVATLAGKFVHCDTTLGAEIQQAFLH